MKASGEQKWLQWLLAGLLGAATALGLVAWWLPPGPVPAAPGPAAAPAGGSDAGLAATHDGADDSTAAAALPAAPSAAEAAAAPEVLDTASGSATALPPQAPPLRIVAEPDELRVWANTSVRLRIEAESGADVPPFSDYVWHFEDGSDPARGLEVEHVFAESVRDRHVTVEALTADGAHVVVSKRLPVERLEVVPVDGDADGDDGATLPARKGPRLLLAGGALSPEAAQAVARAADRSEADAVVASGDAASAAVLAAALEVHAPDVPLLHLAVQGGPGEPEAPLVRVRDAGEAVHEVRRGDKPTGVLTLGEVALVAVDTRPETVAEPELKRLREALQVTSAYGASLLLTARPLTLLRDGELIADRAYRIYEHALRQQVAAVVSASSGVAYDGRFGGLRLVAVGAARHDGCARLQGNDACQPPTLTVLDLGARGQVRAHVLTGADFAQVLPRHALPAEVGKVRR